VSAGDGGRGGVSTRPVQSPPRTRRTQKSRFSAMDAKLSEKIVQVALIAAGLITYCVATYLIVKIVVALNALNTVPAQPKKLPEARALEGGHVQKTGGGRFFPTMRG
jgi:hypothetical protein